MKNKKQTAEFLIFQIEGKELGVEVFYKDENVWRTQKAMSALFDCEDGKSYQTQFFSPCGRVDHNTESNSERLTSTEAHV